MKIVNTVAVLLCITFLAGMSGCGGSDAKPGPDAGDVSRTAESKEEASFDVTPSDLGPADSEPEQEDVPLAIGRVSGMVRDENGLPVAGASVSLLTEPVPAQIGAPLSTDAFGVFDSGEIEMPVGKVRLRVVSDGRKIVDVVHPGPMADVSITQPAGDGDLEVVLPATPVLEATRQGADVLLSWTPSDAQDFHSYRVMRGQTADLSVLSSNVGIADSAAAAQLTDRNLPAGTMFYRVYVDIKTADGHFMTGSNVVSVEVPAAEAMPDKQAFVMLKTGQDKDLGMINTAYLVVAPTDISEDIGAGKQVTITSPLTDGQPKAAMYIGENMTNYKGNKNYYYGNPATYVGETRKLDEWDTKYAVTAKDWAADKRVGDYLFDIDGAQVSFTFDTPMPDSRVEDVKLVRDADGVLTVTWQVIEDGLPLDGGPGNYGWKYLVKIAYSGIYASGTDPDFEAEKMWTNYDIFDKELNIGFSRVCEVAANMPQDVSSVTVPEGIFSPGDLVHVLVYAISTDESFIAPESGASGFGKAYMYWLFNYKVMVPVP